MERGSLGSPSLEVSQGMTGGDTLGDNGDQFHLSNVAVDSSRAGMCRLGPAHLVLVRLVAVQV